MRVASKGPTTTTIKNPQMWNEHLMQSLREPKISWLFLILPGFFHILRSYLEKVLIPVFLYCIFNNLYQTAWVSDNVTRQQPFCAQLFTSVLIYPLWVFACTVCYSFKLTFNFSLVFAVIWIKICNNSNA